MLCYEWFELKFKQGNQLYGQVVPVVPVEYYLFFFTVTHFLPDGCSTTLIHPLIFKLKIFPILDVNFMCKNTYLPTAREGNVFTNVCQSFCPQGWTWGLRGVGQTPSRQTPTSTDI